MPVQVTFPGVYVQEIPSGVRTVTCVSTSITMFIGMTKRGRLRKPTRVLSFIDSVTAHNRGTSLICHGTKNSLRSAQTGESTARHKHIPKDNGFNPRQA